jgi:hypothetical protein
MKSFIYLVLLVAVVSLIPGCSAQPSGDGIPLDLVTRNPDWTPDSGTEPPIPHGMASSPAQSYAPAATAQHSPALTPLPISISNGTTIPVTLVVNGTVVETVPPGGYEDPISAALPALPWSIETRSPSGRVLSRMAVNAGDVVYTTPDANGQSSAKGDAVRVDLPCGRLDVWSGPPILGPTFMPDMSLSCD